MEIVDVTDDFWEVVAAINEAGDIAELYDQDIFARFCRYAEDRVLLTIHENSALPHTLLRDMPRDVAYLPSKSAYLFDNVDGLFRGMERLMALAAMDYPERRDDYEAVRKSVSRIALTIEVDSMEADIAGLRF
jgi:hypothetical protein